MTDALLFGGLSWNPAIAGILTVLVGSVILFGSVYLIVATNTGARLGMLISLSALFGFMSILTMWWWIQPPGMGPKGMDPFWKPAEIYVYQADNGQGPARTEELNKLPYPNEIPTAAQVVREHPELTEQLIAKPENTSLSDLAAINATNKDGTKVNGANILKQYYGLETTQGETVDLLDGTNKLNEWKVVDTSSAGDAFAAVDAELVASGRFADATAYKRLNAYEWNPERQLADECPDAVSNTADKGKLVPADPLCRIMYRVKDTFSLWQGSRYMVIQVQPVIEQEAKPGEPPPVAQADPNQPVLSVVMLRDQGNVRAKPAYFFAISFALFVLFTLMLHYRDKTEQQHLAEAEAIRTGKTPEKV